MLCKMTFCFLMLAIFANVSNGQAFTVGGIAFKNEFPGPIIVQGTSKINNMVRNGQPILIQPGRVGWDLNVPPGPRLINIFDANQPQRILLQNKQVPFQNRDLYFSVLPINPLRVDLKERPPGP